MMLKKNNTQERHKNIYATFAGSTYQEKLKLGSQATGQRLNRALHAFHRLYQVSSFSDLFNIGSTKTLLFSGFDQNAQINLMTCRNSELMAGSQYAQITRSLLKTGLLLSIELLLFLLSRSKMDQPFPPNS